MNKTASAKTLIEELYAINGTVTANDIMAEAKLRKVKLPDRSRINLILRKLRGYSRIPNKRGKPKKGGATRARFEGKSKSAIARDWIRSHGDLVWSEARPLLKAEGLPISESLYTQQRSKVKKGDSSSSPKVLTLEALLTCMQFAKALVAQLGQTDAIRLLKSISS